MTSLARLWIIKREKKKRKEKGTWVLYRRRSPNCFSVGNISNVELMESSWTFDQNKTRKKLGLAHSVRRKEKPLVAAHRRIWFTVTRSNFFCFLWLLAAHENEWKNCIFLMAWQIGSYCPVVSNQLFTKNPKQQSLHSRHCVISVNLTPCIRPMEEGQQEITINH